MANNEFEKLSGYKREEIEGKRSWTEFVVKEDLEKMKVYHYARREDPESTPTLYEFRFIDKNGKTIITHKQEMLDKKSGKLKKEFQKIVDE